MSTNYLIKLSKSLLLTLALVGSGMALFVPTAQAVKVSVNNFRGTWNAWANYRAGDIVGYQNQSYIAQQANHAQTPTPASPVWYLLAAQGPKGDTGETGPAGPQGPQGAPGINGTNGSLPMLPAAQFQVSLTRCGNSNTPQWGGACHYAIGDTGPAGGVVFYVTGGGIHGLEAAPVDQDNARWGCQGFRITGATGTAIGTGAANTTAIVAGCTVSGIAAKVADAYSLNGYDDWFLPSKDELNLMYANIGLGAHAPFTNVGGFANNLYWSSTQLVDDLTGGPQLDVYFAWLQNFGNGYQNYDSKDTTLPVRAVRAF